jgi:hypothetical protein
MKYIGILIMVIIEVFAKNWLYKVIFVAAALKKYSGNCTTKESNYKQIHRKAFVLLIFGPLLSL